MSKSRTGTGKAYKKVGKLVSKQIVLKRIRCLSYVVEIGVEQRRLYSDQLKSDKVSLE